jgi:YHS domain-containing protein
LVGSAPEGSVPAAAPDADVPPPTETGGNREREVAMTDTNTVKDPVCGMSLTPMTATTSTDLDGQTYYFCSEDCYHTFIANPKTYIAT